jgi:formiminotetrahydrofolate cyclodeaminase/Zn-dependent peptidase ImmA (M78 family)
MTAKLIHVPTAELLSKFGAGNHKPGSGSAAALQGMLSARLLQTVISLTSDPKRAKHYAPQLPRLREIESAVEGRIIPSLERLFQEDSDQFDRAIKLRQQRENEIDPFVRKQWADQATSALVPATEIPIQIAKDCAELARFALDVFDKGFRSALGDSGAALSAAISGLSGSLFIVELNLRQFESSDWTARVRASCNALMTEFDELTEEARKRLASQVSQTERKALFSRELQAIAVVAKGKRPLSEAAIEALAIRLQRAMWNNKDCVWKTDIPDVAFDVLNPDKALECFGLLVHHATTLGQYASQGDMFEVAGQIDQTAKVVSISEQFSRDTQHFTTAHELGHYLLHTQSVLHRDRPLNGLRAMEPRDSEEWQADKFASYFLMPTKLVKRTFARLFLTEKFTITEETTFALNEQSTRTLRDKCRNLRGLARLLAKTTAYNGVHFYSLSEQFNVSDEAMAIRLEELKLLYF